LLSLYKNNIVITKNKYNERDDIRELLVVNKKYLNRIENSNSNCIIKNDNSNSNKYTNDKNMISSNYSTIIYITLKNGNGSESYEINNSCIQALDDNENFEFDGIKLKNIFDKIIKFGIGIGVKKMQCNL